MNSDILSLFPLSATCDEQGHLCLAGRRVSELAQHWGTPLYLYDAGTIERQVADLRGTLKAAYPAEAEIAYAAKAYFSLGLARRLAAMGLGVDVVSWGELDIARRAGFTPEKMHLHGNNKSLNELEAALDDGLQAIVVDSLDELALLESLAQKRGRRARSGYGWRQGWQSPLTPIGRPATTAPNLVYPSTMDRRRRPSGGRAAANG